MIGSLFPPYPRFPILPFFVVFLFAFLVPEYFGTCRNPAPLTLRKGHPAGSFSLPPLPLQPKHSD